MTLNEPIIEDATLTWFEELGYAIGYGPHIAPGEYAGGTLIPAFSQWGEGEARATDKESLSVQNTSKGG